MKKHALRNILLFCALSGLTACANNPTYPVQTVQPTAPVPKNDPYEHYNQSMFKFNDRVYTYVASPLNTVYTHITPAFARTGVKNAFRNVGTVPDMANDVLQWNWRYFAKDTARLVLNTTLGFFGLIDIAGRSGINPHQQGFTYTLAKWGYANSNYIILPIIGPNTVSGTLSFVPDYFMNPTSYVNNDYQWPIRGAYILNTNASAVPQYKFLKENSIDPYSAMRDAYLQNRSFVIEQIKTDGNADADDTYPFASMDK